MEILTLSNIIGQAIIELRFHYDPENEYGLQSFHSYIKLASGNIISIPCSDENEFLHLTMENLDYLQTSFKTGKTVDEAVKKYFEGQIITDFLFRYYNGEVDMDHQAILQLSNGYYLTENNYGPVGLTNIDLVISDQKQFLDRYGDSEIRSFLKTRGL